MLALAVEADGCSGRLAICVDRSLSRLYITLEFARHIFRVLPPTRVVDGLH